MKKRIAPQFAQDGGEPNPMAELLAEKYAGVRIDAVVLVTEHAVLVVRPLDALGNRRAEHADDRHHPREHLLLGHRAARPLVSRGRSRSLPRATLARPRR